MTPEIEKFIVLGTGHISRQTAQEFENRDLKDWFCTGGPYGPYGWFIYAHDENSGVGSDKIPADLWAVMLYARSQNCSYILLDQDGDTMDELPIFVW